MTGIMRVTRPRCGFMWGSHGCGLPARHSGTIHLCEPGPALSGQPEQPDPGDRLDDDPDGWCCAYDVLGAPDRRVRFPAADPAGGAWGSYIEGWWLDGHPV